MSKSLVVPVVRPSVRMPFRVLAGILCIATVVAIVGAVVMTWRGDRALSPGDVLMLPLALWMVRLAFHAAVYGRSPYPHDYWPFASKRVWMGYELLLVVYWMFR